MFYANKAGIEKGLYRKDNGVKLEREKKLRVEDIKKFIIFGGGQAGAEAFGMLGGSNVYCFCDNDKTKEGKLRYGIKTIGFNTLMKIKDKHILLIALNDQNAMQISEQLESRNVFDYVFFYDEVKQLLIKYGVERTMGILSEYKNRIFIKSEFFRKINNELRDQINYLRKEIDVKKCAKAVGFLRQEQIKNIEYVKSMLNVFEEIGINPFALGGTLIGVYRHQGFVPWDDDIDFGITRADYERLMEYARNNWYVTQRKNSGIENYRHMNDCFTKHVNKDILIETPYCTSIMRGTSIADYVIFDLFIFDYFEDNYSYEDYRKEIIQQKEEIGVIVDERRRLKIEQEAVKQNVHIVKHSQHLSFSLDSMMAYDHLYETAWIDDTIIFPTKKERFEDVFIPVPNNMEQFLLHDIPGYKSVPGDIGIHSRLKQRSFVIRNILPVVEIYLTGTNRLDYLEKLYLHLREKAIYAIFVIENSNSNEGINVNSECIEEELINRRAEYVLWPDKNADAAVTVGDKAILSCYGAERIVSVDCCSDIENVSEKILYIANENFRENFK